MRTILKFSAAKIRPARLFIADKTMRCLTTSYDLDHLLSAIWFINNKEASFSWIGLKPITMNTCCDYSAMV